MPEPRQRFLVIRLSSIGDIVHTLPAVAVLGKTFPQAEIHWAIETRYAGLLEGNPFVHRVVKLDTLGWRKKLASAQAIEAVARSFLALREVAYEAAIDFQGLFKSGLIAWLSHSQARLGLAEYWLREPAAGVFYTERVSARGRQHVIEESLALVERLGARSNHWQFPLPRTVTDDRYVEQQLASRGAGDFIIISPGGGWITKRWSPDNYAELIRFLDSELPWKVLLTGSPEEEELIQEILRGAGSRAASYFPSTIVQFIALARRAKLFVGGDTGPLHLAAAVGTPIVAIYGPTDPARNGPFSRNDVTLSNRGRIDHTRRTRTPAYLSGVSTESVLAAIRQRLARAYG